MLDQSDKKNEATAASDKSHEVEITNQGLHKLKVFLCANWLALSNVLLLMGGDDSVDITLPYLSFLDFH